VEPVPSAGLQRVLPAHGLLALFFGRELDLHDGAYALGNEVMIHDRKRSGPQPGSAKPETYLPRVSPPAESLARPDVQRQWAAEVDHRSVLGALGEDELAGSVPDPQVLRIREDAIALRVQADGNRIDDSVARVFHLPYEQAPMGEACYRDIAHLD